MSRRLIVIICAVIVLAATVFILSRPKKSHEGPRPLPKAKKEAKKREPIKRIIPVNQAKIAIVLDDWGYRMVNLKYLDEIRLPVTLAILPNLPYSTKIAEDASSAGYEVIIYVPMEAHDIKEPREKNTLLCGMDQSTVGRILESDFKSVPGAKGISNHQGSKATEDKDLMRKIFADLKKRNVFFLDSFVTIHSVCGGLSREAGIKSARRSVFIDNLSDHEYIKNQMKKLKYEAISSGEAIAIGHDREDTLKVLVELMPEFEKDGIKFVYLSELEK